MTYHFVPLPRPVTVSRAHVLADSQAALTVVRGQAGSGKTTLLAEYARSVGMGGDTVVWVSLRADDSGHGALLARIADRFVLAEVFENSALEHAVTGEPPAVARLIERLLEELPAPPLIVLDDYHHIMDSAADETLVQYAERGLVRLVVGTRHGDGLQSSRTGARVSTSIVDSRKLYFTVADTVRLLELTGVEQATDTAVLIHNATRGWPLASYAFVVEAQRGTLDLTGATRGRIVRDILKSTVVGKDARLFRFALQSSLADEISVSLAAALTGESEDQAQADLAVLEVAGLGSWRTDSTGSGNFMAFHPLVQEELSALARKQLDRPVVRRALACIAEDASSRRVGRAFELFIEAREWERADRLLRRNYGPLTAMYRAVVVSALESVPRRVLDSYPVLLGTRTVLDYGNGGLLGVRFRQGLRFMTTVWKERRQSVDGLDGLINSAFAMGAYRLMGDATRARRLADTAIERLENMPESELDGDPALVPTILTQVALTYVYLEDYDAGLHHLSTVYSLASNGGTPGQMLHALALTAFAQAVRGDMVAAHEAVACAETIDGPAGWRESYFASGYRIARAHLALERGDPEAAHIELDALNAHPTIEHWPYIALARARATAMSHGFDAGVVEIANATSRMRWRPAPMEPHRAALAGFSAELLALEGQVPRAEQSAAQEEALTPAGPRLSRARIALARGAHLQAAFIASEVTRASSGVPRRHAESLLVDAHAQWLLGRADEAISRLERALAVMRKSKLSTPSQGIPRSVVEAIATSGGLALDGLAVSISPDDAPPVVQRLTRREREVLAALLDGSTVRDAAAELFVSEETIRFHLKKSYKKLGVSSRADALHRASDLGLISHSLA